MAKIRERLDPLLIWSIVISSFIISFLDFFGLLESIPWLAKERAALTLLIIGMIAAYLVLERRNKLDKIENLISDGTKVTLGALGGVYTVKVFKNDEELIRYTIERMHEAKASVDDLTWRSRDLITKTPVTNKLYDKYLATKEEITTQNDRFTYREIVTIRSLDALDRIETIIKKNIFNFHIKYYPAPGSEAPPPMTFVLIDSEEVIVIAYRRQSFEDTEGEIRIAIKHPDIVKLFNEYYRDIWRGAKRIREGRNINQSLLNTLRQELASSHKT